MKIQANCMQNASKFMKINGNPCKIRRPPRQGWPSPAQSDERCLAREKILVTCLQSSEGPLGSHREPHARSPGFSKKSKERGNLTKKKLHFFCTGVSDPASAKICRGLLHRNVQWCLKSVFRPRVRTAPSPESS